ncbi:ferrous iron transport protein B [Methanospirillum sp.]|uniref:ferrous iron transport protein B n=1 Tax=Methanospirillum sp. TaxID=45200 RepID=UPI002986484E|nr:ferrous iron transport protein B [Methanospirillum sp.]
MKIGLIGNPNVGKSLIFSHLTGIGVEISNYPGTTVDIHSGVACIDRTSVEITDLPGIYSLDGEADEERLVRDMILSNSFDVIVVVLDATHLERNLYLLLQVLEHHIPVMAVLNMADEAEKQGLHIDIKTLSQMTGVPVLLTSATLGKNIAEIIPVAKLRATTGTYQVAYDRHIEAAVRTLMRVSANDPTRVKALLALQGIGTDPSLLEAAKTISSEMDEEHRMPVSMLLAGNRHHAASEIKQKIVTKTPVKEMFGLDNWLLKPFPGIPIMVLTLLTMLLAVFFIGSFFEELIVEAFEIWVLAPLAAASLDPLVYELLFSFIIAIQAGLGIAFPFVFTFYLLMSVIEDTGYMSRIAFLADRIMHKFGLHGQAIIPMVLGLGCNVPAIMAIRQIGTKRERHIAAFLITMVPCSARTVIIAGIVSVFVGLYAALSIYLVILVLILLTGFILSRFTPGNQLGMVLEVPPLRRPIPVMVLKRAWINIREFLVIAMPLLMVSSVFLGLIGFYGYLEIIEAVTAPLVHDILGLPPFASTALLFGILRKEMAFETLVVLAGTANLPEVMTKIQLYIFALVSTLFVPCVSTIAVLYREQGLKTAALISLYTVFLGFTAGAVFHWLSSHGFLF